MVAHVSVTMTKRPGNFGRNDSNFLGYYLLRGFQSFGTVFVGTLGYWDRSGGKKSRGLESGEPPGGGHPMTILPKNISRKMPSDRRAACAVEPHLVETTQIILKKNKKIVKFRPSKSDNSCRATARFRGNCSMNDASITAAVFSPVTLRSVGGFFFCCFLSKIWIPNFHSFAVGDGIVSTKREPNAGPMSANRRYQ